MGVVRTETPVKVRIEQACRIMEIVLRFHAQLAMYQGWAKLRSRVGCESRALNRVARIARDRTLANAFGVLRGYSAAARERTVTAAAKMAKIIEAHLAGHVLAARLNVGRKHKLTLAISACRAQALRHALCDLQTQTRRRSALSLLARTCCNTSKRLVSRSILQILRRTATLSRKLDSVAATLVSGAKRAALHRLCRFALRLRRRSELLHRFVYRNRAKDLRTALFRIKDVASQSHAESRLREDESAHARTVGCCQIARIMMGLIRGRYSRFAQSAALLAEERLAAARLGKTASVLGRTQRDLQVLQSQMLSAFTRKVAHMFSKFDTTSGSRRVSRLALNMIFRGALDSLGFEHVPDAAVVKMSVRITGSEFMISRPRDVLIGWEEAVGEKTVSGFREIIQDCSKAQTAEKESSVVEFAEKHFAAYDCWNAGRITQDALLLIFARLCGDRIPHGRAQVEILLEFDRRWQSLGYSMDSQLSKDETVAFVSGYNNCGCSTAAKPPLMAPSSYSGTPNRPSAADTTARRLVRGSPRRRPTRSVREAKVQTAADENRAGVEAEKTIRNLSTRLSKLETVISFSSANKQGPAQTPTAMQRDTSLLQEAIRDSIKDRITMRVRGPQKDRFVLPQFSHKCNSEYCLLCRNLYHN